MSTYFKGSNEPLATILLLELRYLLGYLLRQPGVTDLFFAFVNQFYLYTMIISLFSRCNFNFYVYVASRCVFWENYTYALAKNDATHCSRSVILARKPVWQIFLCGESN